MTAPVSVPVTPPEPNSLAYGYQQLALFISYTRDSYLAAFGVQAPAWDPTRVQKTWFDTTVDTSQPTNVAVYNFAGPDSSGSYSIQQMIIPASEAATVNIPGAITYPPYVVPLSDATRAGVGLNANYLSIQADAQALMKILGGTQLIDEGLGTAFPTTYPPDEPRRLWAILLNGEPLNVGILLLAQNANGIGAPGSWDTSTGDAIWVPAAPAPTGLNDMRPPRPMPCRSLLPNEAFERGLMGVSVVRTDLQQQQNEQAGEFTPDDRATLQQIYQIISQLL